MISLAKTIRSLVLIFGMAMAAAATSADASKNEDAQNCAVTGSATGTRLVYDPFNPNGLTTASVTMHITRANDTGGGTTSVVNFFLRASPATGIKADGASIIPRSVLGQASIQGIGNNVFYNYNLTGPTLSPIGISPTGSNRFLKISFTGNNAGSNSVDVNFDVNLPPNLDLNAVQNLSFDAVYFCNIQGGQSNGDTQAGTYPNALTFPVTVLSALRTYFAGTALDFGEIGNITTGSLSGSPKLTGPSNYVFVQSSGAYSVTLSSQNGFKLFRPGAATNADKVNYQLRFLGVNVNPISNPTPGAIAITRSCQRATLTAAGNTLPIQAKLLEGGSGKTPSPTYSDILTITVTPLIYTDTGANACASYSLSGI